MGAKICFERPVNFQYLYLLALENAWVAAPQNYLNEAK